MTSNTRLTAQLSIDLIAGSQTVAGAYPASPAHEVYRHGWLRDGSWCAYAMDRAGKPASAAAWHRWVANTLLRQEHRVDEALAAVQAGTIDGRTMLPARFTLDGDEEPPGQEEWPNFQLDCYRLGEELVEGARFYGSSYFCDPRGTIVAQASESDDEVLVADLDLELIDEVRTTWQFFRDRRPETYSDLAELLP